MKTGRYSLIQLLTHNEIEQIIIPEIQRDYVWGISNVKKLIDDIQVNFDKKINHQLEIMVNGEIEQRESINQFLSQEYERLIYNQKLGFIYAYHDRDYAGKFFLIDGQQRITTLYLMLLYLYNSTGKNDEFAIQYFNQGIPKVDYKVREQSHEFLLLLISSVLKDVDFRNSEKFYSNEYLKDTTIQHLIENYDFICKHLDDIPNKLDFLNYLENFVEVNYFDTHLSEQGEQLYIYMNSRGEQLSHQEIIRAELMQKVTDPKEKIELGKEWEKWQNFFWKQRGNVNENADNGFEEFLKWAVIIHLSINENVDIENFADSNKAYTTKQLKENYIKDSYKGEQLKNQKESTFKYQVKYLDFEFLKRLFDALEWSYYNKTKYIPIQDIWLSNIIGVLDYVVLLPVLYYQMINEWEDDEIRKVDIERLAMFIKNITFFEAISKNPDTATLDTIALVNSLRCELKDLINLESNNSVSKTILTDAEKYKLNLYLDKSENRNEWEKLIWEITLDEDFSKFLMGDISVIWKCLEKEKIKDSKCDEIIVFKEYVSLIRNMIFKNRSSNQLRSLILCKFDYLIVAGTGGGLEKYSFIGNGNSWDVFREWRETLIKDGFVDLLIWLREKATLELSKLLIDAKKEFTPKPWCETFINSPSLLMYCGNKKILWGSEHRILLLEKTNYSLSNSKEIQCAILQDSFKENYMRMNLNNCCFLDFNFENGEIKFLETERNSFALEIVYNAQNYSWSYSFFHHSKKINELVDLNNNTNWIEIDKELVHDNWIEKNRLTCKLINLPDYDEKITMLQNNKILKNVIHELLNQIAILIK